MVINFKYFVFSIIMGIILNNYVNATNNIKNEIDAQNNIIYNRIDTKIEYAKQQLNCSELILKRNPNDEMEQYLKIEMLDYIDYLTKLKNKSDISRSITPSELNMLGL